VDGWLLETERQRLDLGPRPLDLTARPPPES
jgi:hypothetical protein